MKVKKYSTLLDDNKLPELFLGSTVDYKERKFVDAGSVVGMMNDVFRLDRQTEEFLYELSFNTKMELIAQFEISHGTVCSTPASPMTIFQKALICGASDIILIHNHPSGDETPSLDDFKTKERLDKAGEIIGIPVVDNIIVGEHGRYFSFYGSGLDESFK